MKKVARMYMPLIGMLGILVAVSQWDEFQTKKDKKEKDEKNKLFNLATETVTDLTFTDESGSIVLTKAPEGWQIKAPIQSAADEEAVVGFLEEFARVSFRKIVTTDAAKWPEFGVQGAVNVQVKAPDQSLGLVLGNDAPASMDSYLRIEGKPEVYLVSRGLIMAAHKSLFDLRYKGLTKTPIAKMDMFTFRRAGQPALQFRRDDQGKWQMIEPQGLGLDEDALVDFVSWLGSIRVKGFIDQPGAKDLALFSKDKAALAQLSWQPKGSAEVIELEFGDHDKDLVARYADQPRLYLIEGEKKSELAKTVMDFRDRRITHVDFSKIDLAKFDGEAFVKKGADWFKAGAPDKALARITNALVELEYAKTDRFDTVTTREATLGQAQHTWQLSNEKDPSIALTLRFWPDAQNERKYWLAVSGDDRLFRIGHEALVELNKSDTVEATEVTPRETL